MATAGSPGSGSRPPADSTSELPRRAGHCGCAGRLTVEEPRDGLLVVRDREQERVVAQLGVDLSLCDLCGANLAQSLRDASRVGRAEAPVGAEAEDERTRRGVDLPWMFGEGMEAVHPA